MHTCLFVYMYIYIYTYICPHPSTLQRIQASSSLGCSWPSRRESICCIHVYICLYVYRYVYIYKLIHIYKYKYIYIYVLTCWTLKILEAHRSRGVVDLPEKRRRIQRGGWLEIECYRHTHIHISTFVYIIYIYICPHRPNPQNTRGPSSQEYSWPSRRKSLCIYMYTYVCMYTDMYTDMYS